MSFNSCKWNGQYIWKMNKMNFRFHKIRVIEILITKNLLFFQPCSQGSLLCVFLLLTFVFCVLKRKGMTTKKPEEATYFMAGNSSRILEKIQIHFEINFVSLNDSI